MPTGSLNIKRAASSAALSSYAPVTRTDPPLWETSLRPNRSLGTTGFRYIMIIAAIGLLLPSIPFLLAGAGVFWLGFAGLALTLLWLAITLNNHHGRLREHIGLWPDLIAVERHEPNGKIKRWQCNPYWMRSHLHKSGGPVKNYLTLTGNDRCIELGAFLSPQERVALYLEIETAIKSLGQSRR